MNLKSKTKGSSTMVVPVRRRLRTKTPPAAAQRVPSMGLVRRSPLRNLRPSLRYQEAQEEHQDQDTQEEEEIHLVYQALEIVRNIRQVFRFNHPVVHQEMEETEETQEEIQEEIQEEMMARPPRTQIKTSTISSIASHPRMQTVGTPSQSTSPEGEQGKTDLGIMVRECGIGHVNME